MEPVVAILVVVAILAVAAPLVEVAAMAALWMLDRRERLARRRQAELARRWPNR